jgi:hypothetical protein
MTTIFEKGQIALLLLLCVFGSSVAAPMDGQDPHYPGDLAKISTRRSKGKSLAGGPREIQTSRFSRKSYAEHQPSTVRAGLATKVNHFRDLFSVHDDSPQMSNFENTSSQHLFQPHYEVPGDAFAYQGRSGFPARDQHDVYGGISQ